MGRDHEPVPMILLAPGKNFEAPVGAVVIIESGEIN